MCLGPLTNLALAIRLDPQMPKKLKEVFVLGGNMEGKGDSSVCAEQNFHHDPEAAFCVLEEIPNITLLPFEVCDRHKLSGVSRSSHLFQSHKKKKFNYVLTFVHPNHLGLRALSALPPCILQQPQSVYEVVHICRF